MMLSEMFNFQNGGDLLGIPSHLHAKQPGNVMNWRGNGGIGHDWYNRQGGGATNPHLASLVVSKGSGSNNDHTTQDEDHDNMNNNGGNGNHQGRNNMNADAAAMHLFVMNPEPDQPSAPMHMLLPGAAAMQVTSQFQHLHPGLSATFGSNPNNEIPESLQLQQLNWANTGSAGREKLRNWGISDIGAKIAENQGLSLSLSSLQHLEAAMQNEETAAEGKGEELRVDGVVYYPPDQGHQGGLYSFSSAGVLGNGVVGLTGSGARTGMSGLHLGSSSTAAVLPVHSTMILRNSKYLRAAQELLGEFCCVGRGQMKGWKLGKQDSAKWPSTDTSKDTNNPSSSLPPLSSSDRFEQQRKKTKLLSMLDELDRRYHHYCEQMQQVMNSFDSVLGLGSALPYTSLAQKAMSRHFRCLRDAMVSQLRATSELLGEKDAGVIGGGGGGGITKGETPRLRLLEQSLRQQRAAFHGMLVEQADQAWRPQRGLPERSVNILRAWLFEHFLHPYPSDADKHLLSRQTGLSRNQVSNWFINARVRLWKPMVEDMYQEEAKEEGSQSTAAETSEGKRPEVNIAAEKAQTTNASAEKTASTHNHSNSAANAAVSNNTNSGKNDAGNFIIENDATPRQTQMAPLSGDSDSFDLISSRVLVDGHLPIGYGGNGLYHGPDLSHISLTLGLRHAGGLPEQSQQQGRFNKHGERQLLRDLAG